MFKKFFVVFLVFITLFSFTACGGQGEKGEKGDTGAQGPQGVQGPQGPAGDSGLSDTLKIYQLGETAKVYSNGILVMSIKYDSKNITPSLSSNFTITNNGFMPDNLKNLLSIRAFSLSLSLSGGVNYTDTKMLLNQAIQFVMSYDAGTDWLCFMLKDTNLILAAFEI